jgi:hypothetical protein
MIATLAKVPLPRQWRHSNKKTIIMDGSATPAAMSFVEIK